MNIFLLISETIYQMETSLKELTKDIPNVITFNLEENTLDEVLTEASYFSMFDDRKCLVVKNAKFFMPSKSADTKKSKEDSEKLLKYMANENKNTRIVFVGNSYDSRKKIVSTISENGNLITFPKMTKTDMKNELLKIATNAKYKVDDKSLWYIINNSLNNFDLAYQELKKIMLYYGKPSEIKYNDVEILTSKSISENNFKLVDSIVSRNLDEALKNLEEAKILKVEPSVIIALLGREFRLMLSVILYEENKYAYQDVLRELKLADWQYQKIINNLRLYKKEQIKDEIVKLSDLDYRLKSGLINKDIVLINYILDLCL